MNLLKLGVVSCCYLGCSPFAPGTVGTLGGVAIAWALRGQEHYLWLSLAVALVLYAYMKPIIFDDSSITTTAVTTSSSSSSGGSAGVSVSGGGHAGFQHLVPQDEFVEKYR